MVSIYVVLVFVLATNRCIARATLEAIRVDFEFFSICYMETSISRGVLLVKILQGLPLICFRGLPTGKTKIWYNCTSEHKVFT